MTAQLVADLRAARALVEKGWCQHNLAVDVTGVTVNVKSPEAARFCAMGAIDRAGDWASAPRRTNSMVKALYAVMSISSLVGWNDAPKRTQSDVLAAFDRAIILAEQEPTP